MQIEGRLLKVMAQGQITSKTGKVYNKAIIIVDVTPAESRYQQTIALETIHADVIEQANAIHPGDMVRVNVDVTARELADGRVFNSFSAWRVVPHILT